MGKVTNWINKNKGSRNHNIRESSQDQTGWLVIGKDDCICVPGYTALDHNPEILTACRRIAELMGSMTIHLMANTDKGDKRIVNELSRKIDIEPMPTMSRSTWMQSIIMTLLLYGQGNAVVVPHTWDGIIKSLEPIAASRVSYAPRPGSFRNYRISIDGVERRPDSLLHFVYNPDKTYLWKGSGVRVALKDIAKNLKQAQATTDAYLSNEYRPNIIVKVDALTKEFAGPEGRQRLIDGYLKPKEPGAPWVIPANQFQVEQVKPLTLSDLAIKDTVELDKRMVAAIFGVPAFLLGVGEYNEAEWNNFIQNTIRPIAVMVQQVMTNRLITNPKWYLRFNVRSLMNWDLEKLYRIYGGLSDRALVTGNEARDILGMDPRDGLDELRILENYIPLDRIGDQSKLTED